MELFAHKLVVNRLERLRHQLSIVCLLANTCVNNSARIVAARASTVLHTGRVSLALLYGHPPVDLGHIRVQHQLATVVVREFVLIGHVHAGV